MFFLSAQSVKSVDDSSAPFYTTDLQIIYFT